MGAAGNQNSSNRHPLWLKRIELIVQRDSLICLLARVFVGGFSYWEAKAFKSSWYLMQICYWKSIQKYFLPTLSCWLTNSFSFTFVQEVHSLLNFPFKLLPVTLVLPAGRSHTLSGSYSSSVKHSHNLHESESVTFFLEGIFKCCLNYTRAYVELTINQTEKCYHAFLHLKLIFSVGVW